MNTKTIITTLLATLMTAAAAAQTTVSALTSGGTYYVYNVQQQQYLADDGNGTLTLSAEGMPITITLADSDSSSDIFFMTCANGKLSASFLDADVKTDGTGQYDHWRIAPIEGLENTYTIACRFRETAAFSFLYWGQVVQKLVKSAIMPGFDYKYGHWQFVTEEDYESSRNVVITLDEDSTEYTAPTVTATDGATVRLKRTLTLNSWNTFCVPFDIDATQFASAFGSDAKAAKFTGSDETTLYFTSQSSIEAGEPYLLYPTKEQLDGGYYEFTGVKTFASEPQTPTQGIVTFHPSFYKTTAPQGAYVIRKNVVYHLTSDMTMKGFRGYFKENSSSGGKLNEWKLDGTSTGIASIEADDDPDAPVYNIAGQRVNATTMKGVYIKNGKKHITK